MGDSTVVIYPQPNGCISDFHKAKYEREARKHWDVFYKRNGDRFFKDRHYLHREWEGYLRGAPGRPRIVLEVGCGAGNTIYPLLEDDPSVFVHACDFSSRAVDLVKAHPQYNQSRVNAFVADITTDDLHPLLQSPQSPSPAVSGSRAIHSPLLSEGEGEGGATSRSHTRAMARHPVDAVTMVFVLSAISPEKMPAAIANVAAVVAPGGFILVRDYAAGDLAQERLGSKEQKISDNFYVRGDGTRAYYFTEGMLEQLFATKGFSCVDMKVHERTVSNRAKDLHMHRRWIQAAFKMGWAAPDSCQQSHAQTVSLADGFSLHLAAVSREHQHTQPATGLMLWDSSLVLSRLLLSHPRLFARRRVLELGCGCLALCSVAAATAAATAASTATAAAASAARPSTLKGGAPLSLSEWAVEPPALVVASDGDEAALALLMTNLIKNGLPHCWADGIGLEDAGLGEAMPASDVLRGAPNHIVSPIHVFHLPWGSSRHHEKLRAIYHGDSNMGSGLSSMGSTGDDGFDLVIGADVVYQRHAVPLLFQSARALLKDCRGSQDIIRNTGKGDEGACHKPLLVLCHITRHVSEGDIVDEAMKVGFQLAQEEFEVAIGEKREALAFQLCNLVNGKQMADADQLFRIMCFAPTGTAMSHAALLCDSQAHKCPIDLL